MINIRNSNYNSRIVIELWNFARTFEYFLRNLTNTKPVISESKKGKKPNLQNVAKESAPLLISSCMQNPRIVDCIPDF